MNFILRKFRNSSPFLFAGAVIFLSFFMLSQARAESKWWGKGVEVFKTFSGNEKTVTALSSGEIGQAFKEALHIGTENVVGRLGSLDGFNTDPTIHIPLPEKFDMVKSYLDKVGMGSMLEDLELKLNRAAEEATPRAKELFWQAITDMTFEDVMTIYNGPDDAATKYFQDKMSPALAKEMSPVVEDSLAEVGAIQAYDATMSQYKSLPFVPDVSADLTEYVVEKGMDGVFHYIGLEEAAIRQNPAMQTTDLLKRVFGAQ